MKKCSKVDAYYNPILGIVAQYEHSAADDALCYIGYVWGSMKEEERYGKSEKLPETIEKMVLEKTNSLKKMAACILLFEYAPYTGRETAEELFLRVHYTDPCGKYDINAIKRLCVKLLEEIVADKREDYYWDMAVICLRRMYDVEYVDGIFEGYLTDEELKVRREKHKVCFAIVPEEGYNLLKLRRLKDIAIMGIFKKKSVQESITITTKAEWNSLMANSPITLKIDREEIMTGMLIPCEEEQEFERYFRLDDEFVGTVFADDMDIKEIVDTYFRFVEPDFCIEVDC